MRRFAKIAQSKGNRLGVLALHSDINELFWPVGDLLMSEIMYNLHLLLLVTELILLFSPLHNMNKCIIFILFSVGLTAGTPANKEFRVLAVLSQAGVSFDIFEKVFQLIEQLL